MDPNKTKLSVAAGDDDIQPLGPALNRQNSSPVAVAKAYIQQS
jgi:hypothetical protein